MGIKAPYPPSPYPPKAPYEYSGFLGIPGAFCVHAEFEGTEEVSYLKGPKHLFWGIPKT